MSWTFACVDWAERLRAGKSLVPQNLPLDDVEAARALAIFGKLRLPDVVDRPTMAVAAGEWQRDIVRVIFGSLIDGIRHVPELFVMVPKKNSKTTGAAAIALTGLLMNKRPRAEFIYVGPTQEVADLAFNQTVGMIEADEYLVKRFHIAYHTKTITDRRNKARLKVKTFDMKVVTGSKPSFILLDELHLMAGINGADRIIGQIRGGMLPNPEAVLFIITTQSDLPPAGVFKSELQYARGVRDGRIKESRLLPLLYEFPESMQYSGAWADSSNWPMVLPNLGRSIFLDRLILDFGAACEKGDEEKRRWASQHLNVEIGIAMQSDGWRGADYWIGAADRSLTLDALIERSEVVTFGGDGGGLDDLLGVAVMGREKETRRWLLWSHALAHEKVLDLRKDIAPRLRDFEAEGSLTICATPSDLMEKFGDLFAKVNASGKLPEKNAVGLDPNNVAAMIEVLNARGMTDDMLRRLLQGQALSPAWWGMEMKLADGTLAHSGLKLMDWVVGNAKVEPRGNGILITKQQAGRAKIDPLIAAGCAAILMSWNPESRNIYVTGRVALS